MIHYFAENALLTIGCVPITDEGIEELYILAVEARNAGQDSIPVHIFPTRLDSAGMEELGLKFGDQPGLIRFWENLKTGFDYFQRNLRPPRVSVSGDGNYDFH